MRDEDGFRAVRRDVSSSAPRSNAHALDGRRGIILGDHDAAIRLFDHALTGRFRRIRNHIPNVPVSIVRGSSHRGSPYLPLFTVLK